MTRKSARERARLARLASLCYAKAHAAFHEGDRERALAYSRKGHRFEQRMQSLQ